MARALIIGASGQDGAYLSRFLLDRGYTVFGASNGKSADGARNLSRLGVADRVELLHLDVNDPERMAAVLDATEPDEIYYLAAQSSVARSFDLPLVTFQASADGLVNLLAILQRQDRRVRLFNAASGDCFGESTPEQPINEDTRFAPRSYYAAAKCAAHHAIAAYRIAYGGFACSGFLFNHESPLRPPQFVTGKIVEAVRRIAAGSQETLQLGNVEAIRDWGWAGEYVEAMWLSLQQERPGDYVIASGRSHKLVDLVAAAFAHVGLDWRHHVETGAADFRPADVRSHYADPSRIREALGWEARMSLEQIVSRLVDDLV